MSHIRVCNICKKEYNKQKILQDIHYLNCESCYNWLTDKEKEKEATMCSNCNINPIAEKQLCGFTDWCEYCDSTLWSVSQENK